MSATSNIQFDTDGLPVPPGKQPIQFDKDGLPIPPKKKDQNAAGSPSPSGSSPTSKPTEPVTGTSDSDPKQVTANFKNQSLTPQDVGTKPLGEYLGPSPDQLAHSINNKAKNIDRWKNEPSQFATSLLLRKKQELDSKIADMDTQGSRRMAYQIGKMKDYEHELETLKNQREYFSDQIKRSYDYEKESLVPELSKEVKLALIDDDFDPVTHTLTPVAVEWIARKVDGIMNKKNNAAVNAQVSGDLNSKERTYADLTKSVVDQMNMIPIQKEQQRYASEFAKKHPEIKAALDANEQMHDYFSEVNYDDLNAKIKMGVDKLFIQTQDKYFGRGGIFMKNADYVGIQEKYAKLVGEGKMDIKVAKKQMKEEISQNPNLKKVIDNFESEKRKIIEGSQKQYENWLILGFLKDHPKYTVYKDGTVGLASMSEEDFKKMTHQYAEGMRKIGKDMGAETNEAWKRTANLKADIAGPFWGSLAMSANSVASGLTKMIFNKTGWGGDRVRNFQAHEIADPSAEQSDVAATWNWKGWESLLNPNFYLSGAGKTVPALAGAAAVSAATEGAGLPEYIGWLGNAGLFTAQSSLSTYDQLVSGGMSESDAANLSAKQASRDFLPNFLMMSLSSGTLLRAKNIVKPTIGGTIKGGLLGAVEAQPFFTWQGYNDYSTMLEAQGKTPDIWDYMQSKDFKDNLVNGLVLGGGLAAVHAPFTYAKGLENWQKLIHTSEGDFKNLLSQNYALGQEMSGNGNYLRDALKMHVFNIDPEGLNEEGKRQLADLKNTLVYSANLDKNIRTGNLDKTNIRDLYQAHNLALADQYDFLSGQATKENNKSLSDIYKNKAKDYREQAQAAANDQAKFHYLINSEGQPIFMSDRSFQALESEGKIAGWMKDGTIQGVHSSEDPEFASRYKDFVATKDEATVQGKEVSEHGEELIEKNKDKLGTYYSVAKENPASFYKDVADQVFGRNADGTVSLRPDAEVEARTMYGDDIVDMAKALHPEEKTESPGGDTLAKDIAKEGEDLVSPVLSRVNNAEYINEKELDRAANHLYNLLDETDQREDLTPEQKKSIANLIEPLITKLEGYEFRTKTEASTVTEKVPTDVPRAAKQREVRPALEQSAGSSATVTLPDGVVRQGTLNIRDGQYVVDVPGGNQIVLGEKAITDRDLKLPSEDRVENPIQFDADGNVSAITFETRNGNLVTINDPEKALDMAIQLRAEAIGEVPDQQFDTVYQEVQREVQKEVPAKDISSPKKEGGSDVEGDKAKAETKGREDVLAPKEGEPKAEQAPSSSKPTAVVDGPPPTKPPLPVKESPKEERTSVNKEKQKEIDGAQKLFDTQKVVKWTDTYNSGLANVQAMYPDKPLYEAMKSRVQEFLTKLDGGILYNPTSEDIAVFNVFKHITKQKMAEIKGWDSPDDVTRAVALTEFSALHNDLFNVVRVNNPLGEAGRAFNLLQSEIATDPENGLQIRRLEMMGAKGGGKLTTEELDWTSEQWQKEKELMQQQHDAKTAQLKEKFDKELDKLRSQLKSVKPDKITRDKGEKIANSLRGIADKIEKFGKADLPEGTQRLGVDLQKNVADAIRWIADKIADGDIRIPDLVYAAIDRFKGKESEKEMRDEIHARMKEAGVDDKILAGKTTREEAYRKIKEEAEASWASAITKDMAGKNLIRDYVKSYIGLEENSKIVSQVTKDLKSVLPDVDEESVRKAYLKEDEFKQPTKKQLESGLREATKNFDKLNKIEKDIKDLTEKKDLYKRSKNTANTPYDKEVEEREKEKKDLMTSMGVKNSSSDKYARASYDQRASSHNDRIDSLINSLSDKISSGDFTSAQRSALTKLKNQLDAVKVKMNPDSKLSQEKVLEAGISAFKSVQGEFNRESAKDISKVSDVRRELQKISDKFNSDKENSEQEIKFNRTKESLSRQSEEYKRKIAAGEFEDNPPVVLTKSDAELIKIQNDLSAQAQSYDKKKKELERKNRSNWSRLADVARGAEVTVLIGSPFTLMKVAGSALLRPQLEAVTKLTAGKVFEILPFDTTKSIVERAKEGGESLSLKTIAKGYEAYFRQYSEEQLRDKYLNANDTYEKSDHEYQIALGEGKSGKELQDLKNKRDSALLNAVGNVVYQYIAGSSVKEAMEALGHRTVKIERMFGQIDSDQWEKGFMSTKGRERFDIAMQNFSYVMNFVGRSHAALKNFSARQSFAAGFMARLEAGVRDGVDVTSPDRLLEMANASYNDFERGKYQQYNWLSNKWNEATRAVEKAFPQLAYLMKADIAIVRVPVNMLHEGIMEYTAGAFKGSWMAWRAYNEAKGLVLQDGYTEANQKEFREAMKEQLNQIDPDKAATILRCFRKGGFGLGLYALALLGSVGFGGFAHKGQTAEDKKKKKMEDEFGVPVIKTGQIKIGNWEMPEAAAKIVEHTPAFTPMLFGLGLSQVYDNNIKLGKSTVESAKNDAVAHVLHILNSIPQMELIDYLGMNAIDKLNVKKRLGEWQDVDQNGEPMKRQALGFSDYFKYQTFGTWFGWHPSIGDKNNILSENYYKMANRMQKDYEDQISEVEYNPAYSKEEKAEMRKELIEKAKEELENIYQQNKENPQ